MHKRILIVEDSLDTAQTLLYLLRDNGHTVDFAINGYAALVAAERQKPDIVLLDMGLPDFDGLTLIKRLKRTPGLEHTRIIAVTGRSSDEDEQRAMLAGCSGFLRKPVDIKVLEAALAAHPAAGPGNGPAPQRPKP